MELEIKNTDKNIMTLWWSTNAFGNKLLTADAISGI